MWIYSLPPEVTVARIMLNKTHSPLPKAPTDPNVYELMKLVNYGHCIVIVCLPTGVYGKVSK